MSTESRLASLPVEVLIDHVLPSLPTSGLLNLSSTNKQFATLGDDDIIWKRKLLEDFNFSGEGTARTSGWKFIYRGLARPRTYVWGDSTKGRLGLTSPLTVPRKDVSVPYPTRLRVPGKRIVSLVPGGWSFHALDDHGDVHVWGTMDATLQALKSDGFSEPSKEAIVPHRLVLNEPIRSVSAGRAHTVMLTATGKVLNFQSWGLPYTLAVPALRASGEDAIKQVEAGWAFGAALTHSGKVYVWWPASDPLKAAYEETIQGFKERVKQGEEALRVDVVDGTTDIPCHLFELDVPPTELGDFPADLPDLPLPEGQEKKDLGIRIIKIAAADNFLIALTNGGHVLKHDHLMHQTDLTQGRWEYMPNFSEVGIVREHEVFKKAEDDPKFVKPPQSMRITHISAHFHSFVAYSTGASSIVLMGSVDSTSQSQPSIKRELQHRDIISVVLGDYHRGALTSTGKLLTWGSYSLGALGLGDPSYLDIGAPGGYAEERIRTAVREGRRRLEPPPVEVPTEVRFGREGTFVIQAAAAGWHMGALVIDLDPNATQDEDDLDEHVAMPGAYEPQYISKPPPASTYETPPFNPHALPTHAPGQIPTLPMLRGRGRGLQFRIGLAGARGRGMPLPPPEGQGGGL